MKLEKIIECQLNRCADWNNYMATVKAQAVFDSYYEYAAFIRKHGISPDAKFKVTVTYKILMYRRYSQDPILTVEGTGADGKPMALTIPSTRHIRGASRAIFACIDSKHTN